MYKPHLCEPLQYFGGEEVMGTPMRTPSVELNTILVQDCTTSHAQALYTSTVLKHFLISLLKSFVGIVMFYSCEL